MNDMIPKQSRAADEAAHTAANPFAPKLHLPWTAPRIGDGPGGRTEILNSLGEVVAVVQRLPNRETRRPGYEYRWSEKDAVAQHIVSACSENKARATLDKELKEVAAVLVELYEIGALAHSGLLKDHQLTPRLVAALNIAKEISR